MSKMIAGGLWLRAIMRTLRAVFEPSSPAWFEHRAAVANVPQRP
jgi:hypothetical protein